MNGWIKLFRQMLDWEWYQDANCVRLFVHCLLMANHEPKRFQGKEIPRGAFLTGRKKLAAELGLSEQQIRSALTRLQSTNEITIQSTNEGTMITVSKYACYQCGDEECNQQINQQINQRSTNDQPTINQPSTTNKKDKNDKKERNIKADSLPLPFPSSEFASAWADWQKFRREIRKPLTPTGIAAQFKKFAEWGEARSIASIRQSILSNWQGLFEPRHINGTKAAHTQPSRFGDL